MLDIDFPRGLYELMDAYDGFIIDQWGVLHNGAEVNREAFETLNQLKKIQKQVVILSNSAKRSQDNKERLKKWGFKSTQYLDVVTSGEVTWNGINQRIEPPFNTLGRKVYLICRKDDEAILNGLEAERVARIEDADFILITGLEVGTNDLTGFEEIFKKAIAKHIPAICANPDTFTLNGKDRSFAPGALAAKYQEMGGAAHYIGKPHKTIFRYCLKLFDNIIPSRVLVIGDSLKHDISGASNANIDSLFITSGIHNPEFRKAVTEEEKRKAVNRVVSLYGGIAPKYVMSDLIWQTKEAAYEERLREKNNQ